MSQLLHQCGTRLLVLSRIAAGPADRLAHPWRYQAQAEGFGAGLVDYRPVLARSSILRARLQADDTAAI